MHEDGTVDPLQGPGLVSVEGERCEVSSWSLLKKLEVHEEEEEEEAPGHTPLGEPGRKWKHLPEIEHHFTKLRPCR